MKTYVARNTAQAALARILAEPEDLVFIALDEEELPDLEHISGPLVLALHKIWQRWGELRGPFCERLDAWAKKNAPRSLKCRNDWKGYLDDIRSPAAFESLVEMIDGLFVFFDVVGKEHLNCHDLLLDLQADGVLFPS